MILPMEDCFPSEELESMAEINMSGTLICSGGSSLAACSSKEFSSYSGFPDASRVSCM